MEGGREREFDREQEREDERQSKRGREREGRASEGDEEMVDDTSER